MTTAQLIFVASVTGAILFFVAGAAMMALRQRSVAVPLGVPLPREADPAQNPEIARLRHELEHAQATVRSQAQIIDEQNRLFEAEATKDAATAVRDLAALRERARLAEATDREAARLRTELAKLRGEVDRLRADGERHRTEVERLRADSERHRGEVARLRAEGERHRGDAERLRAEVEELRKQAAATAATERELRRVAEDRGKQVESARSEAAAAANELAQLQRKLADLERQLADKTSAARDLSTENEQLKGRLRDADALRAEYVRLRTATTDSEYLRREIARLEKELHEVRVSALGANGAQRPRAARGTDRPKAPSERTIGESLAKVMEGFADAGTRSSAVGDPQGFPLASVGADGVALAAYAALLNETASRAKEYLPVGAPSSIELVDANGVRVSVWSLEVESDRLLLANLAVSPVDSQRVESALVDLTQILAPSTARTSGARP